MYFATSKDILYLVISFCVLWITVFLCWMLYYVMRLLRDVSQIIEEFRMRLQALTEAIQYIRGKVESISGMMTLATEGVTGFVKNAVQKKVHNWMDNKGGEMNDAAKTAVDKAIASTAKKMHKTAMKIRK